VVRFRHVGPLAKNLQRQYNKNMNTQD